MAVESATYVNQLVPANPPGTDVSGQGYEHLQLIKQVTKTTFPNVVGPVTASDADFNNIRNAVLEGTGTVNASNVAATTFAYTNQWPNLNWGIVPSGTIVGWMANWAIPTGWTDLTPYLRGYNLRHRDTAGAWGIGAFDVGSAGGIGFTVTDNTATMPSHTHAMPDPGHAHGVYDPGHNHGLYNNGNIWWFPGAGTPQSIIKLGYTPGTGYDSLETVGIYAALTNISLYAAATGLYFGGAGSSVAYRSDDPWYSVIWIQKN